MPVYEEPPATPAGHFFGGSWKILAEVSYAAHVESLGKAFVGAVDAVGHTAEFPGTCCVLFDLGGRPVVTGAAAFAVSVPVLAAALTQVVPVELGLVLLIIAPFAVMWFSQSKSFEADWALDTSSAAVDAWKAGIGTLA